MRREAASLQTRLLADGTPFLTDGVFGMTRFDPALHGTLIDIPTLHVRCADDGDVHSTGKQLLKLCDPGQVREFHHQYGHDFPRGHVQMKKIAQLIRETAEAA